MTQISSRSNLTRFAWLSIAAAVITIALKTAAYLVTGSVGLLSDALESIVNLLGAFMALFMLSIAAQPEDEGHSYGHDKAEYFSSTFEGILIMIAAIGIAGTAIERLLNPRPLDQLGLGLIVSVVASLVNLGTALVLRRNAKTYNSITLKANSEHLMTDVWTSVGVLAGVGMVGLTRLQFLDPVIAILVAANIIWSGFRIVKQSVNGLMDAGWPEAEIEMLNSILESYEQETIQFHAVRTRLAGARRFVSFHVLMPGNWTVQEGHHLLEEIEKELHEKIEGVAVFTHMEPMEDPAAYEDIKLDRQNQSSPE